MYLCDCLYLRIYVANDAYAMIKFLLFVVLFFFLYSMKLCLMQLSFDAAAIFLYTLSRYLLVCLFACYSFSSALPSCPIPSGNLLLNQSTVFTMAVNQYSGLDSSVRGWIRRHRYRHTDRGCRDTEVHRCRATLLQAERYDKWKPREPLPPISSASPSPPLLLLSSPAAPPSPQPLPLPPRKAPRFSRQAADRLQHAFSFIYSCLALSDVAGAGGLTKRRRRARAERIQTSERLLAAVDG